MHRLTVWMVRAALVHLGLSFTVGGLILFHKGIPLGGSVWRLWPLHVESALTGWVIQLAMGMAVWILPRWRQAPRYGNTRLGWIAFVLLNLGVIAVGVAPWISGLSGLAFAGRLAELLAVSAFVMMIWPRVKPLGR